MTNFDADTLRELRHAQEPVIRTEKHPKSAVVIWVVVADDEVFVRSWRGPKGASPNNRIGLKESEGWQERNERIQ